MMLGMNRKTLSGSSKSAGVIAAESSMEVEEEDELSLSEVLDEDAEGGEGGGSGGGEEGCEEDALDAMAVRSGGERSL